eukprot:TRINITY_DN15690_c0_g1_i1.p1 TRINITY_DN15690_c0_g1~~TRINITY_DN15690_c0_g1_i1.p1  ORF type:complete len:324 (+),score=41.63 TRINITY_DN15690_c0_g1_i1:179-1150(+)
MIIIFLHSMRWKRAFSKSKKKGVSLMSWAEFKETLKTHALDVVLTVIVWSSVAGIHFAGSPHDRFFVERDPTLSYPYEKGAIKGEEVPNWLVTVLSLPVVMILLFLVQLGFKYGLKVSHPSVHPKVLNLFVLQLAFLEAIGIAMLVTGFLKNFEGRKRPNFYAMCNYHGYRDALETNDPEKWEQYLSLTVPGRMGDMANCLETDPKILRESQYSFPSGHSSSIWCGFTFVAQTVLYLAHRYSPHNSMGKGVISLLFFTVAAVVAGSRPRDYWHNFDDVLAGSIIGSASAVLAFSINYSEVATKFFKKRGASVIESNSQLLESQ